MDSSPVSETRGFCKRPPVRDYMGWLKRPNLPQYDKNIDYPYNPNNAADMIQFANDCAKARDAEREIDAELGAGGHDAAKTMMTANPATALTTLAEMARRNSGFSPNRDTTTADFWNSFARYFEDIGCCPFLTDGVWEQNRVWENMDINASIVDWVLSRYDYHPDLAAELRAKLGEVYAPQNGGTIKNHCFAQRVIGGDKPWIELVYVFSTREPESPQYKTSACLTYGKLSLDLDCVTPGKFYCYLDQLIDHRMELMGSWLKEDESTDLNADRACS